MEMFLLKTSRAIQNKHVQIFSSLFRLVLIQPAHQDGTNDVKGQGCQRHLRSFIIIYHSSEDLFIDGGLRNSK